MYDQHAGHYFCYIPILYLSFTPGDMYDLIHRNEAAVRIMGRDLKRHHYLTVAFSRGNMVKTYISKGKGQRVLFRGPGIDYRLLSAKKLSLCGSVPQHFIIQMIQEGLNIIIIIPLYHLTCHFSNFPFIHIFCPQHHQHNI
jgi:hypothetical protein